MRNRFILRNRSSVPIWLRPIDRAVKYPLVVTTNYDDVLETALREAGEEFDLLYYEAKGKDLGKFWHQPPRANPI